MKVNGCSLCDTDGGLLVFKNQQLRVVHVPESGFPAFYRVVWNAHVPEFSSLSAKERDTCMSAVIQVEQVLLEQLQPTKINLAAFGNVVPHLHWHVIARFDWDTHFPAPFWAAARRVEDAEKLALLSARCVQVNRLIAQRMES